MLIVKSHIGKNMKQIIKNENDVILVEKAPDYCLYKNKDVIIETDQNGCITNIRTDLINELFPNTYEK